ncbi:hypothetical protein QK292_17075 [Arthrobacter sp. AL08]|uniref:hypothetical protein n=1 Tax=unclassified Arthrobacter TaxID=235627 RepID=UPI00249ADDD8|nr:MULTISPECIES: hypothetical protein [unclassified Arthrobacter]MDI3243246.1 hypothetical protein [Arthrobacter sp. AL05]MDI3279271.1 hypothetical protein [Arthrobacter sp. AL08]
MEFVPAATLWMLTILRLPAAFDPHRGSVFRATILAAIACTLYIPAVYFAVDPLLGGRNRVGLVTLLSLLLGFWQFRTAILLAAVANVEVRRRQLIFGRSAVGIACVAVATGFLTSRVDTTDPNLPLSYGDQPGMAVFLVIGSGFIIGVCIDIARVCRNNVPNMQTPAFRFAFTLIAAGCLLFTMVLLDRLLYGYVISVDGPESVTAIALTTFYWVGETLAVLLVSAGLLLPRVAVHFKHGAFEIRVRLLLLQIGPVWTRATSGRDQLILEKRQASGLVVLARHPETQLHRRLVEIRDCQMASPKLTMRLSIRDRSVVERAELALEKNSSAE